MFSHGGLFFLLSSLGAGVEGGERGVFVVGVCVAMFSIYRWAKVCEVLVVMRGG